MLLDMIQGLDVEEDQAGLQRPVPLPPEQGHARADRQRHAGVDQRRAELDRLPAGGEALSPLTKA